MSLQTNTHFTLKRSFLTWADLDELVKLYNQENCNKVKATWSEKNPDGCWRPYKYEDLIARDKVSLDLFWLCNESLEDSTNLPPPRILAQEIIDDLRAVLEQMKDIVGDLSDHGG